MSGARESLKALEKDQTSGENISCPTRRCSQGPLHRDAYWQPYNPSRPPDTIYVPIFLHIIEVKNWLKKEKEIDYIVKG